MANDSRQVGNEIDVTPEMVRVGVAKLWEFNEPRDALMQMTDAEASEAVKETFQVMLRVWQLRHQSRASTGSSPREIFRIR